MHQHVTATSGASSGGLPTTAPIVTAGGGGSIGQPPGGDPNATFRTDNSGAGTSGTQSAFHVHGATGNSGAENVGHTHTVPASALSIPDSLYEIGMAQATHIFIDGVDRTVALGGPWGAGSAIDIPDLDITQWLQAVGWHEIQFSSSTLGSIIPQLLVFATLGAS